jgi:hypothetical protein
MDVLSFLRVRARLRSGIALALSLLAITAEPRSAHAEPQCLPGTTICYDNGKVVVKPSIPGGGAQTGGSTNIPGPRAKTQAELDAEAQAAYWAQQNAWRLQWNAYLKWRAEVKATASLNLRASWTAQAEGEARASWNRFAGYTPPTVIMRSGENSPPVPLSYPRFAIGLLGVCAAHYSGASAPLAFGYCPAIELRPSEDWTIHLDPSVLILTANSQVGSYFGIHPGASHTFLAGRGQLTGASAYARIGFDLLVPLNKLDTNPGAFGGVHGGLGVHYSSTPFGAGIELRAMTRMGLFAREPGLATSESTLRAGFMLRGFVGIEF